MPVADKFFMRSTSVIEPDEADRRTVVPEPAEEGPAASDESAEQTER